MKQAQEFIKRLLADAAMQQTMKDMLQQNGTLTFGVWQQVAHVYNYAFTEAEFEAVFAQEPQLADRLWALAASQGIQPQMNEFELVEDELDMIAGGSRLVQTAFADSPSLKGETAPTGSIRVVGNIVSFYKGM